MYALIVTDGQRLPARYATKARALSYAKRRLSRIGEGAEVVWCNDAGVPKVWLAYVTPDGVSYTDHWLAAA